MTSTPPPGYEGFWTVVPAGGDPDPGIDPLSRRLLQLAAVLSALLILVLANALLRGGGDSINPIAMAAQRAQHTPGSRLRIEVIYSSANLDHPVLATGGGTYNARTKRSRVSMTVPRPDGVSSTIVAVGDDRTVFMRSPEISGGLPRGKPWISVQPWLGRSSEAALASNGGVSQGLQMLGAAGEAESVGAEKVRGVDTQRYRTTVDLGRFAATLQSEGKRDIADEYRQLAKLSPDPIEVEAWVDDRSVLRRMRQVMTLPTGPGRPQVTMDMRVDLYDFGVAPKVRLPHASEVIDMTPLVRAELHLLSPSSAHSAIHPVAGGPMSRTAFRARGNAVCTQLKGEVIEFGRRPRVARALDILREAEPKSLPLQQVQGLFRTIGFGFYEPAIRRVDRALHKLGRLAPPAASADDFERFLRISTYQRDLLLALARAAEVGDLPAASRLEELEKKASKRSDRSATRAGLGACADNGKGGHGSTSAVAA